MVFGTISRREVKAHPVRGHVCSVLGKQLPFRSVTRNCIHKRTPADHYQLQPLPISSPDRTIRIAPHTRNHSRRPEHKAIPRFENCCDLARKCALRSSVYCSAILHPGPTSAGSVFMNKCDHMLTGCQPHERTSPHLRSTHSTAADGLISLATRHSDRPVTTNV